MFCKNCGIQIPDDAKFCPACGTKTVQPVTPPPSEFKATRPVTLPPAEAKTVQPEPFMPKTAGKPDDTIPTPLSQRVEPQQAVATPPRTRRTVTPFDMLYEFRLAHNNLSLLDDIIIVEKKDNFSKILKRDNINIYEIVSIKYAKPKLFSLGVTKIRTQNDSYSLFFEPTANKKQKRFNALLSKQVGLTPTALTGHKSKTPIFTKVTAILLVAFMILEIFGWLSKPAPSKSAETTTTTQASVDETTEPITPLLSREEYIAECETVAYSELVSNPDDHMFDHLTFTGEVLQVAMTSEWVDTHKVIILKVEKDESGYFETIYLDWCLNLEDGDIKKGDTITVYGFYVGLITYTNALEFSVISPRLYIQYYTIH